jgi:hypothetical protein
MINETTLARLMAKVEFIPMTGCWIFMGAVNKFGHGIISTRHGETPIKAHRASYIIHHGAIPAGHVVRHKCDVPSCICPHHLETGTQKQNMQDCSRRGRINPKSLLNLTPGGKIKGKQNGIS